MDDEIRLGWQIDPEVRAAMRMDRARTAFEQGDFPTAVMEAEELLDEQPDHAEALFLLGESLLELSDFEGALLAYEHHVEAVDAPDAQVLSGLAIARFNLCDLSGAITVAREAIHQAPDTGEAHYYLGLALERLDESSTEAVAAFAAAHRLDPESFPFPLGIDRDEWESLIRQSMTGVSPAVQRFWLDIPILLEGWPDLEELRSSDPPITPTVTGLYRGDPPVEGDPWATRPEALRLYTRNLVRSPDRAHLVDALARTFDAEARDWLGLTPQDPL